MHRAFPPFQSAIWSENAYREVLYRLLSQALGKALFKLRSPVVSKLIRHVPRGALSEILKLREPRIVDRGCVLLIFGSPAINLADEKSRIFLAN